MVEAIRKEIESECQKMFAIAKAFKAKLLYERKLLPYNINVIDELHINENAHSRILTKLLNFQNTKGKYEILESLIHYIQHAKRSSEFESIKIDKPHITQEEARIDLWVRDSEYAIIFENKIYNAEDRDAQLARYIDKTKDCGYDESNIFVVYLSQAGCEPANQSWGCYKETFRQHYVNLSFRNDILSWLKNEILPSIRQKDFLLHSAILQYKDYLEGLFYLRTIEKQMNMNLDNFIINHLDLKGKSTKECISILHEKINDFDEVVSKMETLLESYKQRIIDEWKERTKNSFPDLEPNSKKDYGYTNVTFHLPDGKAVVVFIDIDPDNDDRLYCQAEFYPAEQTSVANAPIMKLSDFLPQHDKDFSCIWKYGDYWHGDYDAIYDLFVDVAEKGKLVFI